MHSPWRLDERRATLELGPLDAYIDLDQPALGLQHLKMAGSVIAAAQLLGVELPPGDTAGDRLVEAYLRGADLIATYADIAQPAFRWQIYWRALPGRFPQALAAIEAIVSVQTGLLDSWPQLTLRSVLPTAGAALWHANSDGAGLRCERFDPGPTVKTIAAAEGWGCFGFDLPGAAASYVEMVHPADFDSSTVEYLALPSGGTCPGAGVSLRHALFRERLEKGVILRSRVLGLLLPEWPTCGTIADIQRAFVDEELPLTT
jgi:hypothetical protein